MIMSFKNFMCFIMSFKFNDIILHVQFPDVNIKFDVSMWFYPRSQIPSSTTNSTFVWYVTHCIL